MSRGFLFGLVSGIALSVGLASMWLLWDAERVAFTFRNTGQTTLNKVVIESQALGDIPPGEQATAVFAVGDGYHTIAYTERGTRIEGGMHQYGRSSLITINSAGGGYRCPKPLEYLAGGSSSQSIGHVRPGATDPT